MARWCTCMVGTATEGSCRPKKFFYRYYSSQGAGRTEKVEATNLTRIPVRLITFERVGGLFLIQCIHFSLFGRSWILC